MHPAITLTEQIIMNTTSQTFGASLASRACSSLMVTFVMVIQASASEPDTVAPKPVDAATADEPKRADFKDTSPSNEARQLADWILDSNNNRHLPFLVIDKKEARVFAFFANGSLRGAAPVLLGLAVGDDSVPGIGQRKLSTIRPYERTTPAGRFVAALDRNLHGEEILWVDYDAAISLHRVITSTPEEHRAQRLASPTPQDRRISYGCINVPVKFYDQVINPAFKGTNGIVYVLPETRSAREVFGAYDVNQRPR